MVSRLSIELADIFSIKVMPLMPMGISGVSGYKLKGMND